MGTMWCLFDSTPSGRTSKLRNDILIFQQHKGESLSKAWTRFKDLLQKVPHHGIDIWLQIQIFYDHVNPIIRRTIDQATGEKVLVREEIRNPTTKNVNAISLCRIKNEKIKENNEVIDKNIIEQERRSIEEPVRITNNRPLDIKEDRKNPFILGIPFPTTARAEIKFDKGTIALKSGRSKVHFHKCLEFFYKFKERKEEKVDSLSIEILMGLACRIFQKKKKILYSTWRRRLDFPDGVTTML
nr:zinc finger, CCHC-type [Tanacetum cinerariifolium]